ncbi:tetratricopeptide repeat protein [uncultured Aquabacterium sp.]|uniref:tetratricopeptide repeat protein n=1 Tax=Aquabacterium sp. TaxID=1872578 RepID=UPI0025D08388|nr:tetratricopeptide repeat protein [uncultured Aquabacterium sp.]
MQVAVPHVGLRLTSLAAKFLLVASLSVSALSVRADDVADVQKLLSAGKNAEALQKADQFLASKPRDPMMRFLRGISLSQAGRTAEAITAFTKLTEDFPELPEPFNNLAVLYAQQGQYDKARTALEMAIRTNPSYATAYENLGDVYAKLASQAYSKALQIDTRSAVAPKLAMIRDLFPKERNSIVASAAQAPAPTPAPAPVAPAPKPSAAPAPVTPPPAATPSATPPAAKPTPAPAAKPEPAPKPTPTEPKPDNRAKDVESAVRGWADAWSRKDLKDYFAAYARDFDGGKSRKAWEEERRDRINGKRNISVRITNLRVDVDGNKAVARFRQEYKADSLNVSSNKRLDLVQRGNSWVIVKESTGS